MLPTTRDRTDELRELEELWAAPALGEQVARPRRLPLVPGALLVGAWLAFFFVMLPFEPRPEPGMTNPMWGDAVVVSMIFLLLAAAAIGPVVSKAGFALAGMGGLLLIVIAVACRVTTHHMGSWWLAELAAAGVLTGLAAVGLAQRLRRQ
jgi:hypothetical protein